MNIDDLEEALSEIIPSTFQIRLNSSGKLIIYTNLTKDDDGELVDLKSEEEEEEDIDPDFEPLLDDDED